MHPDPAFRPGMPPAEERALMEAMIVEIGFGMVFATTADGPRVAHVPLLSTGDGAVQFHLSRRNALTRFIDGMTAVAVINGPDAYVSPRWYSDPAQVPTWNYVSLEMEGPVRRMDGDSLTGLLDALTQRHEARIAEGEPWTLAKLPASKLRKLLAGIVGFEMEVLAWRPTFKLSQNKGEEDRARIADALEAGGSPAIARLMRSLAP
jgi:transcriptional regulator